MHKQTKLNNGLRVLTAPIQGTKTITILALFKTGSKYENRDNNGISHFLEHMFFKGTINRPSTLDIAGELDSIGGEYNAFTGKEYTGYLIKVASGKIEIALDVIADILKNSKFESEEIERERGVIIEEINMYHDNPMMYIDDIFEQCLYGDTPAGWEISGPKENIRKFQRKDFQDYFNSQYGANNALVCAAGALPENMEELLEKYFNDLRQADHCDKDKVIEEQTTPRVKLHKKDTDQANLSLGVRTYPAGGKNEAVLKLMSVILGGSMSSRLFTQLRERQGLAYYVRTQAEAYSDSGYLTTGAGVPAGEEGRAISTILKEYKRLKEEKVGDKELQRNKDMIRGRTTIRLEASDNVAEWFADSWVLRDKVLTPEEFLSKIEETTAEDIQELAQKIFTPNKLNLAVIGPFEEEEGFKKYLEL
jgi:predicted Zn-dependent peptidase